VGGAQAVEQLAFTLEALVVAEPLGFCAPADVEVRFPDVLAAGAKAVR